jgi:hypothetical protein
MAADGKDELTVAYGNRLGEAGRSRRMKQQSGVISALGILKGRCGRTTGPGLVESLVWAANMGGDALGS